MVEGSAQAAVTNPGSTLLLLEDDPNDADLLVRAIVRAGIRAEIVHLQDGEEGLAWLFPEEGDPPPLPALVVLDWKLPKVAGESVLKRLRSEPRTRRLPVVVLTSSREERDLAQAYDHGANSYVRKPIEPSRFNEVARDIGTYWLLRNEVARP